jgi:hypothetical protein
MTQEEAELAACLLNGGNPDGADPYVVVFEADKRKQMCDVVARSKEEASSALVEAEGGMAIVETAFISRWLPEDNGFSLEERVVKAVEFSRRKKRGV